MGGIILNTFVLEYRSYKLLYHEPSRQHLETIPRENLEVVYGTHACSGFIFSIQWSGT